MDHRSREPRSANPKWACRMVALAKARRHEAKVRMSSAALDVYSAENGSPLGWVWCSGAIRLAIEKDWPKVDESETRRTGHLGDFLVSRGENGERGWAINRRTSGRRWSIRPRVLHHAPPYCSSPVSCRPAGRITTGSFHSLTKRSMALSSFAGSFLSSIGRRSAILARIAPSFQSLR